MSTEFDNPSDDVIREILSRSRRIAIVGCSPHPERDSHRVARFLLEKGHTIVPVNPNATAILGQKCYPTLSSIAERVSMVDVFRRAAAAGEVVDDAIAIGAEVVWMQLGVIDSAAAARAHAAGLIAVMDRCPLVEYRRLF